MKEKRCGKKTETKPFIQQIEYCAEWIPSKSNLDNEQGKASGI